MRECYLRQTYRRGSAETGDYLEIVAGLELHDDELLDAYRMGSLRRSLTAVCNQAVERCEAAGELADGPISLAVFEGITSTWPGRRYFLEVQHDDPTDGYVQVISPSGWPPGSDNT